LIDYRSQDKSRVLPAQRRSASLRAEWLGTKSYRAFRADVARGCAKARVLKAAPRQKGTTASDFHIRDLEDWNNLQQDVKSGKRIERVVVRPLDPELIRNPDFATNLAKLAAEQKIVVERSGGLLSHVYYILQREGAQVECTDLFGADEEIVEYNKLVRDRIPEIIKRRGERAEMQQLSSDALLTALRQKLVEEGFEALDAQGGEEVIGELADVQEVLIASCNALRIPMNELEAEREEKRQRRGGFDKGIMLVKTAAPQSIAKASEPESATLVPTESEAERVISNTADLPPSRSYRRPDLRYMGGRLEKLFTLETEINKLGEHKSAFTFSLPFGDGTERQAVLTVELRRNRASLRTVIRLRFEPPQLGLKFSDSQLRFSFPES
jgi:predicted house-cleaning noncanonical NTP pyrophosphatase (MazG superfamily)